VRREWHGPVRLWTVQMVVVKRLGVRVPHSRLPEIDGIPVLDVTVKTSGDMGRAFAPSWGLVNAWRDGVVSWQEYVEQYTQLMRESYAREGAVDARGPNYAWWWALLQPRLALACTCKARVDRMYCHRYVLVDILRKVGAAQKIVVEYQGELTLAQREKAGQTALL